MEAKSRAHYRMVWEEEIKQLNSLGWSVTGEDWKRVQKIQDELREIVKRGAEKGVEKPEICPDCATKWCAYRKNCPDKIRDDNP